MNITVEKQPNCTATLRVEVPSDAVKSERDRIVAAYASQARIQGFRPGKAPRKVIEKRFGQEISGELEERLARKAFDEALEKEQLKVLNFGQPSSFSETSDGSVTFESLLTLAPDFSLPDYKGVTVAAPSAEITDEEVDQNLESLRERFADYSDIEGRGAEMGDLAVIDYTTTLDGTPLEEAVGKPVGHLSGREGFWLKIDEQSFLPGFAAQLVGLNPGDEKSATVTIPDDFPVADLRGKDVVVELTLKELKQVELPEVDDAFVEKIGGGKTVAELRELLGKQLEAEKKRKIDDSKVNQIVEYFNGLVDFELPEELLRHETQSQADSLVKRGVQSGMSEDDISAQQEEIFATAGMQARTNLKTNFILQEIARVENISVTDQELVGHIAQIAQSRQENPKKFIKQLQREGRIPGIRNSMLVGKAIDFVLEHATVEETSAAPEETSE
ncbi:trigger factor [Haloferula helveola]|uniref:Trigger factor n=1 Tax=Haloferula helveola TaxID=490095 RepID=A0ABM7RPX9_9BACT|nr:trigger factor [Haloferula helveola]